MRVSRTRFQLALWFAGTFFVALTVLDIAFYVFLVRDARNELTDELLSEAAAVRTTVYTENADPDAEPDETLEDFVTDVLDEWPAGETRFLVYADEDLLGTRGPADELAKLRHLAQAPNGAPVRTVALSDGNQFLLTDTGDSGLLRLRVVAARSTARIVAYQTILQRWIFISVPLVSLLAVLSGYLLAKRSLRPVVEMSHTIADIAPDDLRTRLPVRDPPDELDDLAHQFNAMLGRLDEARGRSRRFLAQAAHQIRTPLTLVRGESELGLEGSKNTSDYTDALRRIRAAADQMAYRVDELFLLAHAEAGDAPTLTDEVELDGLVFECTDLMRGRAHTAGRTLEISRADPGTARGNQVLLREAVIELVENALRHGTRSDSIRVAAYFENGFATLEVVNAGEALSIPVRHESSDDPDSATLGLLIVRWIADVHGGELRYTRADGENQVAVIWPAIPSAAHPPADTV